MIQDQSGSDPSTYRKKAPNEGALIITFLKHSCRCRSFSFLFGKNSV